MKREPQPLLSDEEIEIATDGCKGLGGHLWAIPFARRIESLVRKRLAERLFHNAVEGEE